MDDVTPDWMPLLGPVDGCQGLIAAYGMSSHFFKHAPAVGRGLAEYITDGGSSLVDLHLFRPERFREGAAIRSSISVRERRHPVKDSRCTVKFADEYALRLHLMSAVRPLFYRPRRPGRSCSVRIGTVLGRSIRSHSGPR